MVEYSTAVRNTVRMNERGTKPLSTKQTVRKKAARNGHASDVSSPHGSPSRTANPPPQNTLASGEFTDIRASLEQRLDQLRCEYRRAMIELRDLQRTREAAAAGDDQTDAGTKTFEREQELTLAHGILERIEQVERAISRIDEGTYGQCERCDSQIGTARLEAYPSATLCVTCKQHQERR